MNKIVRFWNNNKKRVFSFFIYFIGLFALKGASVILTPFYTKSFTTAEYGTMELANSIVSVGSAFIGMGICQYLGIEYFHYIGAKRASAITKNIKIYCIVATPCVLILGLLSQLDIIIINGLTKPMILLICSSAYLAYFSNLCLMLCKNQQKTILMTILQLIVGLLTLGLNIIGVRVLNWGICSTLIANTITNGFMLLVIPFVYQFGGNFFHNHINSNYLIQTIKISFPLALTSIVSMILNLGDRWIMNYFCTKSDIGVYSLSTKFGNVFELIIVNTLTIFYAPYIYKSFQNHGIVSTEQKNRKNFIAYMFIGVFSMIVFMIIIKYFFPIIIDDRYSEAEKYLWLVLLGQIFLGATYFKTYLINYEKRTKSILLVNVVAMVFNLVTNVIFIPKFQIWAAVATTTCSQIIMFLIATVINNSLYTKEKLRIDRNCSVECTH